MSYSDIYKCHGCGLCTLVCPVWHMSGNVRYTPHGLAKSMQSGDTPDADSVTACILCGTCASICPQNIDLMKLMLELRTKIPAQEHLNQHTDQPGPNDTDPTNGGTVLIASELLISEQPLFDKVVTCLEDSSNITVLGDTGDDIVESLQEGIPVTEKRKLEFTAKLLSARKIIVCNGLLAFKLKSWLPGKILISAGHVISKLNRIRKAINPDDLYIVDSFAYNTNVKTMLAYYDKLRKSRGCDINLDLQRLAIPTGSQFNNDTYASQQAQWLLSGRGYKRIITEDIKDYRFMSGHSEKPVLHIAELLQ